MHACMITRTHTQVPDGIMRIDHHLCVDVCLLVGARRGVFVFWTLSLVLAPSRVSTCVWSVRCVFVACGLLVRKSLLVGRSLANRVNRK